LSIVVLDFGSQYTQLITRRFRELQAYAVLLPGTTTWEQIAVQNPQALVLSGGPNSVFTPGAPRPDPKIFEQGLPILGICYGMQLLAQELGGQVELAGQAAYGRAQLASYTGPLFSGLTGEQEVWMSHADAVTRLPEGFSSIAATSENPVVGMADSSRRVFGLQFHPEVVHTPGGSRMLANFLQLAGVPQNFSPERTLHGLIEGVRAEVGHSRVLLAISGGVDSSTLALLLARSGTEHLAVFVDNGLLRQGEREEVEAALGPLGVNLSVVDASERFLSALTGVEDPEAKRKIIGETFVRVFEEEASRQGPFEFLAQGTLYPDVIESAGVLGAAKIKSHHNVGGLPEQMGFKLLEPFRNLFKDEVRELALLLGLPPEIRNRHPFPGPGLAVRVLGPITKERLELARQADAIFIQALKAEGLYDSVWQALTVLVPAKSVGVVGDSRRYGGVVVLRAVTSIDGMTADFGRLPWEFLDRVAQAIPQRMPQISRVVYDLTSKPPGTIEWE
jgi:GMP synthase (glutamine-hydrolysing)